MNPEEALPDKKKPKRSRKPAKTKKASAGLQQEKESPAKGASGECSQTLFKPVNDPREGKPKSMGAKHKVKADQKAQAPKNNLLTMFLIKP